MLKVKATLGGAEQVRGGGRQREAGRRGEAARGIVRGQPRADDGYHQEHDEHAQADQDLR
jgi:hypothetical protein